MNVSYKYNSWKNIYGGVPQGLILGPLLFSIFIDGIFIFFTTFDMCNYADVNTLRAYCKSFLQVQEYSEIRILEKHIRY